MGTQRMKRIMIIAVCLLIARSIVTAGDIDEKTLKAMVAQLGDDGFRVRRKAEKGILTEVSSLQAQFLKLLTKANGKASDELKTLTAKLKVLVVVLETTNKTSDDPEIKMRLKKILMDTYPSFVYDQKLELQKLIVAKFKDTVVEDRNSSKRVKVNIYSINNAAVMEICDLRVIRVGVKGSEYRQETDTIPIEYQGSWSSGGGSFSFRANSGRTNCIWKEWSFTVEPDGFVIGDRKIPIGKGKNLLIVDAKGGFKSHFKLSQ
jgi:hypothetical protein